VEVLKVFASLAWRIVVVLLKRRQAERGEALHKYSYAGFHWLLALSRNQTIRRFWRDPEAANANKMGNYINSIKERGVAIS
jgi:hypothetical protein